MGWQLKLLWIGNVHVFLQVLLLIPEDISTQMFCCVITGWLNVTLLKQKDKFRKLYDLNVSVLYKTGKKNIHTVSVPYQYYVSEVAKPKFHRISLFVNCWIHVDKTDKSPGYWQQLCCVFCLLVFKMSNEQNRRLQVDSFTDTQLLILTGLAYVIILEKFCTNWNAKLVFKDLNALDSFLVNLVFGIQQHQSVQTAEMKRCTNFNNLMWCDDILLHNWYLQLHHSGGQKTHNTLRPDYAHSLLDPSLQVAFKDKQFICNNGQNVKQMPYSQYLCNFKQLYIGACVVYIMILTNDVQPLLPGWYRWLICFNHTCAV